MEPADVDRAKTFWFQVDVDLAFEELLDFLLCLREGIKNKTASDKEYVQGMNIILQSEVSLNEALHNDAFEAVLISEDILTVSVSDTHCTMLKIKEGTVSEDALQEDASRSSKNLQFVSDNVQVSLSTVNDATLPGKVDFYDYMMLLSPTDILSEDPFAPMSPVQVSYQQHDCGPGCLPHLPAHSDHFLGHNPLRVPLLCHFQRQCAKPRMFVEEETEQRAEEHDTDVLYKAPCGRGLRSMDDVLQFLGQTNCLGILQPTNFSFSPQVLPERQTQLRPLGSTMSLPATSLFERDISRGTEAVPVPMSNEVDSVRPKEFRYRKDRWPHGCFLSKAPFFSTCCDCKDGCTDSHSCSCLQLSLHSGAKPEQLYKHQRLDDPVSTGLYECGPWCRCERSRCQNRVVQRGLRVRLQVFRTHNKGWGVRCRDDLDKGAFVCTFAGVVLRLERSVEEPLSSKNQKDEHLSDDEVEVVEEWTLPTGQKKTANESLDISPPLHVPVIQRPTDQPTAMLDGKRDPMEHSDKQENVNSSSSPTINKTEIKSQNAEKVVRKRPRVDNLKKNEECTPPDQTVPRGDEKQCSRETMYYLDASKEGNVARFINHSCSPNLLVQNVFVDTHDPKFPIIALFTSRVIKAGTELTWNCCYKPGRDPEHEVPCLCGSENCQSIVI